METASELIFWRRVKYSFYATLIFILITNPMTYRFTQTMFQGSLLVLQNGIPTPIGYFLHVILFFLVTLAVMMFPKD
jgi:hypothetical protein